MIFFRKKLFQKLFYIAFINTCANKRFLKRLCSFRNVVKSKSMGTQVSMNEEVPDLLLLEREVDNVISSVETEVSKYELATNLVDSDLDMDEIICDVGNDFQ